MRIVLTLFDQVLWEVDVSLCIVVVPLVTWLVFSQIATCVFDLNAWQTGQRRKSEAVCHLLMLLHCWLKIPEN